jgi:tape measure domain-containing protein
LPVIDHLVIEVDSSGFLKAQGNAKIFESLLNKVQGTATRTEKSVKGLGDNFAAFQLIANKLPGPLKSIASGMMGMVSPATAAAGAALEAGEAVVNFVKESVQAFSDFEMIKANLEVVMGSAEQAAVSFDEIRKMAGKTPFNVEQLADAAVQLKQTGTAAGDLIPVLAVLGNTAGGSSEKFNRIVANFAQIQSVGKTTAMDLRQFAMAGIPVYDMLKQMGVEGNATAEQISEAFRRMTGEGGTFYNAMEKGAATLQGKITNLEGAWKSLQAAIVDKTGLDDAIKYIVDAFQFHAANIDSFINEQSELTEATKAWESGIFTEAQALTVLNDKIKDTVKEYDRLYDIVFNEFGSASGHFGYDADFIKASETLAGLRKQYDLYANIIERDKARTTELERQAKLIEDQKKLYTDFMGGVNSAYESSIQEKIEALRKTIADNERVLSQGLPRQVPSLFTQQVYGPQLPGGDTVTVTGLLEDERRRIETVTGEIKKELESLLKQQDASWLKDWQIELGRIFNFTPTSGTEGLPTVISYINELNEAGKRLFAAWGNTTIADMLGISKQDQAGAELADMQNRLREMMEAKIEDPWTASDSSVQELLKAINDKKKEITDGNFNEYLDGLNQELAYLKTGNEEREKAIFLDNLREQIPGITDDKLNTAWEIEQQRKSRESANLRNENLENTRKELEYLKAGAYEGERRRLEAEGYGRAEAETLVTIQKQVELLQSQDKILTLIQQKRIEARDGGNDFQAAGYMAAESGYGMLRESGWGRIADGAVQGFQTAGVWGAVIGAFLEALDQVTDNMDGLNEALSPSKEALESFQPLVKSIMTPALLLARLLNEIVPLLNKAGDFLSFGLVGVLSEVYDTLVENNEEREREAELLRQLNDQYAKLRDSIRENEEYYLKKRRELNADWTAESMKVNDMILTPQGNFSTNPNDYIIATKNPSALGNNVNVPVYVNIVNNSTSTVTAQEQTDPDGARRIIVLVDQIVQNGIASGKYDGAFNTKQARNGGRRVSG